MPTRETKRHVLAYCPDSYERIVAACGLPADATGAVTGPTVTVHDPVDPIVRRTGALVALDRDAKTITLATGKGALVLDYGAAKTRLEPPDDAEPGDIVETVVGTFLVAKSTDGGNVLVAGNWR